MNDSGRRKLNMRDVRAIIHVHCRLKGHDIVDYRKLLGKAYMSKKVVSDNPAIYNAEKKWIPKHKESG